MRIVFAIKALDDIKGGAERVLADITAGLAEQGHNVVVLSFDTPKGKPFYPLHKKVKRLPLGIGNIKRKATFSEVISRMTAIRKAAVKLEPDVVVAFMHSTFIPASFAMIGTGVPIIASEHIVPDHYKNRRWEYVLLLLSRFFVKKITVLSESIIQSYSPTMRSKMIPIANPVQSAEKMANPTGEGDEKKLILNVGRLTEQKDQETLIRAFALLAKDYPDWNVRIIGDGEYQSKLKRLIQKLNLENRITLPGTTASIGKEYQEAQIFALPSKYESFGLATAEAMSHGLPTIGFQTCPGTNELIINGKNGLLVSDGDRVQDFANGLKTLMDSPALRREFGQKGLASIERFHPNTIVKQWEEVIKETCN